MTERISVVETPLYLARAARLMSEVERADVVDIISSDPEGGAVIQGLRGMRKVRIALQGRGKRGGGRVIYWFYSLNFPVVLLLAYGKNEKDDLSGDERKVLLRFTEGLIEDFGG